jgi:hypothetical protein
MRMKCIVPKMSGAFLGGAYGLLSYLLFDCMVDARGICSSNAIFGLSIPGGATVVFLHNILPHTWIVQAFSTTVVWAIVGYVLSAGIQKIYGLKK